MNIFKSWIIYFKTIIIKRKFIYAKLLCKKIYAVSACFFFFSFKNDNEVIIKIFYYVCIK